MWENRDPVVTRPVIVELECGRSETKANTVECQKWKEEGLRAAGLRAEQVSLKTVTLIY